MKWLLILSLCTGLVGCATSSNSIDFKTVKPKQRVYVGRVSVELNGKKAEKCELFMNSKLAPNMKLAEDGYLVYKTSDRRPHLEKIRCLHQIDRRTKAWHTQDLELAALVRPKKRKSINYFGDLLVKWDIDPEKTLTSSAVNPSVSKDVAILKSSGELQVTVENKADAAKRYIDETWKPLEGFRLETHLAKRLAAGEDEELDDTEEEEED